MGPSGVALSQMHKHADDDDDDDEVYASDVAETDRAASDLYRAQDSRMRSYMKTQQMQLNDRKDERQFYVYASMPENANFLADIDFNIPVATINNIRTDIRGAKWRYHENETKSLFRLIAEKAGSFVIKFKAMELLDDPQRCGDKPTVDMRPCHWCDTSFTTSDDLKEHMIDCCYRDIDWDVENVEEWCKERQWQPSKKV